MQENYSLNLYLTFLLLYYRLKHAWIREVLTDWAVW